MRKSVDINNEIDKIAAGTSIHNADKIVKTKKKGKEAETQASVLSDDGR